MRDNCSHHEASTKQPLWIISSPESNQDRVINQIFAEVHVCKSGYCILKNSNFIREIFLAFQAMYL